MHDLLSLFINEGRKWIRSQRDVLRPSAEKLADELRHVFESYFDESILDDARLSFRPVIPNPTFYAKLQQQGIRIPLDFTEMDGITYDDTILIVDSMKGTKDFIPLVFHELVHVVQYRRLGVDEFMTEYVNGWAENGLDYCAIPLERDAYQLQERFENAATFKVA